MAWRVKRIYASLSFNEFNWTVAKKTFFHNIQFSFLIVVKFPTKHKCKISYMNEVKTTFVCLSYAAV